MNDFILILIVGQIAFVAGLLVQHYRQQRKERSKVFNSLNIPKPKFKVGDKLRIIKYPDHIIWPDYVRYDLEGSEWVYGEADDDEGNIEFYESELELVEATK